MQANLIPASIYQKYSVGRSIRPICTRRCFTMTNTVQVCSNFRSAQVFVANDRLDEICLASVGFALAVALDPMLGSAFSRGRFRIQGSGFEVQGSG